MNRDVMWHVLTFSQEEMLFAPWSKKGVISFSWTLPFYLFGNCWNVGWQLVGKYGSN
jgi:hypothetical protein